MDWPRQTDNLCFLSSSKCVRFVWFFVNSITALEIAAITFENSDIRIIWWPQDIDHACIKHGSFFGKVNTWICFHGVLVNWLLLPIHLCVNHLNPSKIKGERERNHFSRTCMFNHCHIPPFHLMHQLCISPARNQSTALVLEWNAITSSFHGHTTSALLLLISLMRHLESVLTFS